MSEKRRSNSVGQSFVSDTREKGIHQDIVSAITGLFLYRSLRPFVGCPG